MKSIPYFLFTAMILFVAGCSKDDDTSGTPNNNNNNSGTSRNTINDAWQFSVKIDGTTYSHKEGLQDYQGSLSWGASLTTPPDSSSTSFGSWLGDINTPNLSLGIETGIIKFLGNHLDTTRFKSFFQTGILSYNTASIKWVQVKWVDATGDFWSTTAGTGLQTGSNFTITDIKPLGFVLGDYYMKFRATFNCTLYNDITGASMQLTDGLYVGGFGNY